MRLSAALASSHVQGWLIYPLGAVAFWVVVAGAYLVAKRLVTFARYLKFAGAVIAIQIAIQIAITMAPVNPLPVLWLLAALACYLFLMGLVARKVGYRFRDAGLLLIPLSNVQLHIEWLWRLAHLPHRYWERPEKATA